MIQLQSYLCDAWTSGEGPASKLHDATNGEVIAETSTRGLDLGAAMAHARDVGGPTLRKMSFAERGLLLKALGKAIHENRDALIELAQVNSGNTRGDAKFDIDGASGTLAYYAHLGKTLGERTYLLDGDAIQLTRSARFFGQHVLLPRRGVAVHINAFNFPAWGLAEKAACAILAGVPVLAKPATSTAVVTERIVRLWTEAGLLPPGVLSLLTGSAGDLLDHLGPQDNVAFTGSGDTGRMIKGHPRVLAYNVPVNVEADSLNAAILGPDAEPGSDTWEMFINHVQHEITQKAGQKCTATRRIFVPEALADAAQAALVDRLSQHLMGDVTERATTISPLATAGQQRDINAGIEALSQAATQVWASGQAEPDKGYWVRPRLFRTDAGLEASYVHDHEVFGPISTICTYSGEVDELVALVARGGGGLVASLYSDDRTWAAEALLGIAPYHGRVLWGSKKIHDQAIQPGTVLPSCVHGGPGKAGGGEELGGERGMRFYMQRTAIQGDRALLDKVLG